MTEIQQLQLRIGRLRDAIEEEVSSGAMDMINELTKAELLLEGYCNR